MAQQRKTIIRSRAVRGRLLETLAELHMAAPGMGMRLEELLGQARYDTPFELDEQEIQAEIVDLRDHKLIELDQQQARITTAGVDFLRCGLPWDRVDAFSGHVR